MRHTLFPTIDAMLDPATLSELAGQAITAVAHEALQAAYNLSGSHLMRIVTNEGEGPTFIVKRIARYWDWQMRATNDFWCRTVTMWQEGIFDEMPPEIEHATIACANDGDGWAILMPDIGGDMLPYHRFRREDHALMVKAMAALHARFFEDSRLRDPLLGLCTLRQVYTLFSPGTGYREANRQHEVPKRVLEGWEMFSSLVAPDVGRLVRALVTDPIPLCNALRRYPRTLVHGDWRHANTGVLHSDPPRVVLLDWQLAAVTPPSVELGRALNTNSVLLPESKEATIARYKEQLAARLGPRFDESWWEPQLALGLLGGFVQDGWAIALKATNWEIGADARDHWRADLDWWSQQAREGARWLEQSARTRR